MKKIVAAWIEQILEFPTKLEYLAYMERLKKQKEEAQKEMLAQYDPFGTQQQGDGADDDPDNKGDPAKGSQGGDE